MISYAYGSFGKHLKNRQIPYQSVRGPFLVLYFYENFMKIRTKLAKFQIHENLHKNVLSHFYANFHEFYEEQSKQQIHVCYSHPLTNHGS